MNFEHTYMYIRYKDASLHTCANRGMDQFAGLAALFLAILYYCNGTTTCTYSVSENVEGDLQRV